MKTCPVDSDCLEARLAKQASVKTRRASPVASRISPSWRSGDGVRWQGRDGIFRRDVGDGEHAEIVIAHRVYWVRIKELALTDYLQR